MHEMLVRLGCALSATLGLLPRAIRRAVHHPGVVFGLLCICCVWAGVGYSLSVERQTALDNAFDDTGNFALAFEEQIAGMVRAIDQTLLYVRADYVRAPSQFDIAPWSERGEFLTHPAFQVLIGDKDGFLRVSSRTDIKSPVYVGDRDYFVAQAAASEDHLFISKPVIGRLSNKWSIQFTRRILGPDGSFAGVVIVSFDPFYLSRFYESLRLSNEGVMVLIGADGVIRARAPHEGQTIGVSLADTPLMALFAGPASGRLSTVSLIDGIRRIYSYRAVDRYPLVVAVGMSEHDALAAYDEHWRSYLAVASVTSVLLLAVIALFARHQIRLDRAREALRASEVRYADKSRLLEVTLDNMTQGLVMMDAGLTLQVSNRRVAELLDLPEALLATRPTFADFMRPAWQRGEFGPCTEPFDAWFEGFVHEHSGLANLIEEFVRPNGMILEVCRKRLSGGGVVLTFADITERKQLDEALRRSRERLALATESAHIGIWDWDITANKLVWDARMYQLYGIREQDFSGVYDAWQSGLHPDDRARGDAAIAAAIDGVKDFNIEFRVIWPNGEVHDIEAHALVQGTAAGRATRMIGVNWDITERKRASETIRLQADEYAAMLATTSDGFWLLDPTGSFLAVNDAYCRMVGRTREELMALKITDVEAVESAEATHRHMATIIEAGFDRFESQHLRKDGSSVDVEGSVSFWRETGRFLCFARDITERKRAEQALTDSEVRLKTVLETNVDGIAMVDVETMKFSFANRAFCGLLGYDLEEVKTIRVLDIHPPVVHPQITNSFARGAGGQSTLLPNLATKRKDGSIVFADVSSSPMTLDGRIYLVGCFHDVTERKLAEEQIARMARYDSLTGLLNRRVFVEVLEHTIAQARRCGTSFAVLYLDLDHFKDINDTLGHPVGDVLLEMVADRLRANVRKLDTVARFGGDEFAIILTDVEDPANAALVAGRLLDAIAGRADFQQDVELVAAGVAGNIVTAISEPMLIQANRIHPSVSVGIAVFGPDSPDAETMLSRADVAVYRAKAEQRGTYRFFTDGMDGEIRARVRMGTELRDAISLKQFFLMYQPQVDIAAGRIAGLEALVRWHHPTLGILGPGRFIPEAERNGLIVPLGRWIIGEACRQARLWLDAGIAPRVVAVNLSGTQFTMPLELEKEIAAAVAEAGVPPRRLELELTESVLMKASRDHNDVLMRLRNNGHRIAIDDFGSGYSSLDYLRKYPVDRIKIAQTFIADIGIEAGNDAIVRAALGLARELNIEVVVEGVETLAQLDLLRSWGARIVQGYYFSRPLPAPEVTALLEIGMITPERVELVETAAC